MTMYERIKHFMSMLIVRDDADLLHEVRGLLISGILFLGCAVAPASAQSVLPSLFGFTVGDRLTSKQEFIPSVRDRDFILASRMSKNKEYLLQTLKLTKKSQTIASVGASSNHVPDGECNSQLAAILSQLKRSNLGFRQEIADTGTITRYTLSRDREGCSYEVTGVPGRVGCVSYFAVYCNRDGQGKSTLFLEAGDTGISEMARREAEKVGLEGPNLIK